ncbi:4-hydroxythreonine-4-phosphate dehydrogenase PdxA [Rubricoccus marinus]|uniref:4-hydroxythreonine-4-phosphate dehydrogenase n=1 Tax=Rubricoccus marinus TaxID=716817 RepID=A0A259TWI8_9BACT|nr:4-hydroxythreonine-4-phosphate dehydrogenase PdxA [Rubricoccus marinus]OZC02113.1 4-hydroxythreonine-4-phosphate dehydrogenase PdxA [Rubricoccus marinus]
MRPTLALTLGDPNGIGPEIVLKAARDAGLAPLARLVAVGPANVLEAQADALGLGPITRLDGFADVAPEGTLGVIDTGDAETEWGRTTASGGRAAIDAVARACDACLSGEADGMVTAPLSKEAISLAGVSFPGHTEYLQDRTGAPDVVMVLASNLARGALRVALTTVHEPIARVAALVTQERIGTVLNTLDAGLRQRLGVPEPRIAVLGLNPHASDGGVIGAEDLTVVAPAVEAARARGVNASGPFPADAFFGRGSWSRVDAVLAMYHDQGLAPFKALAMGGGVNLTLGLPIVRTSPDHGTAFDIAGRGIADASSFAEAVRMAAEMAVMRNA